MKAINRYYEESFTDRDIKKGRHRDIVGGMWDEIGNLQFDFLVERGLRPQHRFLDVGCGALRGGIHFVRYLDSGNYHGIDLNASLIKAGQYELEQAGLAGRQAHLLTTGQFELTSFGVQFDYALALSVFTHLPMNNIVRCLVNMAKVIKPQGTFFATFFEAPHPAHLPEIAHEPGGITTCFDSDPFHYSVEELGSMARSAGLKARLIGSWNHPRDQQMAAFTLNDDHKPA